MKTISIELPAMYADHHVTEVRRILQDLPGVKDVYASSSFRVVEVTFDPQQVNDLEISLKLDEAGYLGEWSLPVEYGAAAQSQDKKPAFSRHTAVYETTRQVVSFAQSVNYSGRPLWPCPGMGVVKMEE